MAYGIEVYNENENLQFSTDQESFAVIDTGTVTNTSSVDYNSANEILFVRRTTTGHIDGNTTREVSSGVDRWTNASGTTVEYLKVKRTSQRAEDNSSTYGVKVFKSDGTTLQYSSGYSKGPKLIDIISPGSTQSFGYPNAYAYKPVLYSGSLTNIWYGFGDMKYTSGQIHFQCTYWNYGTTPNTIQALNQATTYTPPNT
ncbi:MAG: hypothetical protein ACKVJK_23745, partial [Methylophagaceae bacterium]